MYKYELKFCGQIEGKEDLFPVSVPGNIQLDYAKKNGNENWQYASGVKFFDDIEDATWLYHAELDFDGASPAERVLFLTDGIDYQYECYINQNKFFEHEGMFRPVECDITDLLKLGKNRLTVRILPPPKSCEEQCRDQADKSVKPAVSYGWDWHPRLIPSGLWQGVRVEKRKSTDFSRPTPRYELSADMNSVKIYFDCEKKGVAYTIFDAEGNTVASSNEPFLVIEKPHLWWCRGMGEQYLYTWRAESETCLYEGKIGFRHTELHMNEGTWDEPMGFPKSRSNPPITLTINGKELFAKGSNFVTPNVFTGTITEEDYDRLVRLAAEANMNILRLWGGAGLQKEYFFEACDKYGILVWQEFPLACNNYRNDAHYLAVLESEARAIVRRVRCHPCLAFWCGGNELFNNWSGMTDQHYAIRLLNKICYEEDRETPFIPTSPVTGMAHGPYSFMDKGKDVYEILNSAHCTAYTEFGVGVISPYEVLKEIIPADELDYPTPTEAWVLHHGFGAWREDSWTSIEMLDSIFGKQKDTKGLSEVGAWLQNEGYKAIFEEARRQKPYCSMAINWDFNEPWVTAGGLSLLSHPARPKSAYYAVKDSLRDVTPSARIEKFMHKSGETFTAGIWLLNDTYGAVSDTLSVTLTIGEREIHLLDVSLSAGSNENVEGPTAKLVLPIVDGTDRMTLTVKGERYGSSSYTLRYTPVHPAPKPKILNDALD